MAQVKGFACCFCGEPVEDGAFVGVKANWGEGQWQFWGAHGACLTRLLHPNAQEGPLVQEFGD
jgi:hypothetical protein